MQSCETRSMLYEATLSRGWGDKTWRLDRFAFARPSQGHSLLRIQES